MNEISENTSNEELKKLFLVKIQFRENCTRLSTTWRSKIWSEEIQNTHYSSRNESLNLKDYSYWKIINEQIKLSVREYICLANWRWRIVFTRNATQKVAENLKNWKDAAIKRNILKNSEDWKIFTQPDQESRTASRLRDQVRRLPELLVFFEDSKIFYDPDSPSSYDSAYVSHQALITSSSRKPSRDIGMLRNTREEMSIPGNVFECQHARRDPDELHDDSRNLATTSAILRRNWEKWKRRTIAIDTFSLLFEKSKTKSLDGGKCPVSMTNHTVGIGTCTQGMAIPSYLSSEMHLQKFPDQTKFSELGREFPSRNLRKGEESRARACESWRKERCNILTPSGRLKNVFSGRQLGLVQEETLNSFPHTHATGLRETVLKEVGDARKSHLEQASSSVPKVK